MQVCVVDEGAFDPSLSNPAAVTWSHAGKWGITNAGCLMLLLLLVWWYSENRM